MSDTAILLICGPILLIVGLAHLAFWVCIAVGALRVG